MMIDGELLKQKLEEQKSHKQNNIIEQTFNRGIETAIEVVKIIELSNRMRVEFANRN